MFTPNPACTATVPDDPLQRLPAIVKPKAGLPFQCPLSTARFPFHTGPTLSQQIAFHHCLSAAGLSLSDSHHCSHLSQAQCELQLLPQMWRWGGPGCLHSPPHQGVAAFQHLLAVRLLNLWWRYCLQVMLWTHAWLCLVGNPESHLEE